MRIADALTAVLSEAVHRVGQASASSTASIHTDKERSQLTTRVVESSTTASGDAVDGVDEALAASRFRREDRRVGWERRGRFQYSDERRDEWRRRSV